MCKSQITVKKFIKLLSEVLFYKITIYALFLITGYEKFSLIKAICVLLPITSIGQNFVGCYFIFFLLIPFINILIKSINENQHLRLLAILSFAYILFGTIRTDHFGISMNYVSWFSIIYLMAAYIRLHPKKWFSSNTIIAPILLILITLSALSVIACAKYRIGNTPFYFVVDSNTILAVLVGLFAFLFFKNIKIKYNLIINTAAASTFGILLIHANSDAMRQWLWVDTLKVANHYGDRYMPIYIVGCIVTVFMICAIIDIIRGNILGKPFLKWIDNICANRKKQK